MHSGAELDISYATAMRIFMSPLNIGAGGVKQMMGDIVSVATLNRVRPRVAQCLRLFHVSRQAILCDGWVAQVRQKKELLAILLQSDCRPSASSSSQRQPICLDNCPDSDSDDALIASACSSALAGVKIASHPVTTVSLRISAEDIRAQTLVNMGASSSAFTYGSTQRCIMVPLGMQPADGGACGFSIAALGWKWDGTPIPVYVQNKIMIAELGVSSQDESLALAFTGKGAECFSQRGVMIQMMAGEKVNKYPICTPPKHLADKSANGILGGLEVEAAISRIIDEMAKMKGVDVELHLSHATSKYTFIIVVCVAVDAAATNLLAIKLLCQKYRLFNASNQLGILVVVIMDLCAPHAIHICSRTVFALSLIHI